MFYGDSDERKQLFTLVIVSACQKRFVAEGGQWEESSHCTEWASSSSGVATYHLSAFHPNSSGSLQMQCVCIGRVLSGHPQPDCNLSSKNPQAPQTFLDGGVSEGCAQPGVLVPARFCESRLPLLGGLGALGQEGQGRILLILGLLHSADTSNQAAH